MAVKHAKVDVVTIGAGWTAAMLAAKLCPHGTSMVSLEQGDARWTYPHFAHDHDSLRYSVRYAMMVDLQRESWTWRPNPNAPALPMRQYGSFNPGKGLGGAAVHWSGSALALPGNRLPLPLPRDRALRRKKIHDGCTVQDWGITYDELEPYYDAFEYDIGASGQAGNINGKKIPGGNIFESPRSRDYPEPATHSDTARRELRQGLRATSACTRLHSRPGSHRTPGPTPTATTAAAASTAASAPASAARSTRRQARSTRTFPSH